jgi:hypothetical protein
VRSSSHSLPATARTACSASSTPGYVRHVQPFISTNSRRVTHAARLLPSSSGWFLANPDQEHSGLVDEVWVEVLVTPASGRRMEGGVREVGLHAGQYDSRLGPGDSAGDGEVIGEVWILDRHLDSRSSNSRSSSMILVSLALNSGLFRRRSTSWSNDCLTVSFRLVPSTRASASASAANSSGRRTVMFFVMGSYYHATITDHRLGGRGRFHRRLPELVVSNPLNWLD